MRSLTAQFIRQVVYAVGLDLGWVCRPITEAELNHVRGHLDGMVAKCQTVEGSTTLRGPIDRLEVVTVTAK